MYVLQGYAKLALQEGFHGWWLPSFAVRGAASQLLGTVQVDMTVFSVDVLASKAFGIGGTARIEPFVGLEHAVHRRAQRRHRRDAQLRRVRVQAGRTRRRAPTCAASQTAAPGDDLNANFTFPEQDVITRQRWFGGFKLKLSVLFMAAQVEFVPAGTSRDELADRGRRRPQRHAADVLAVGAASTSSPDAGLARSDGLRPRLTARGRRSRRCGAADAARAGRRRRAGGSGRRRWLGPRTRAPAAGIPPWMILRRPATESRGVFFSSSKMICASVAVVRSARVVFSTTRTSSPARTIAAM